VRPAFVLYADLPGLVSRGRAARLQETPEFFADSFALRPGIKYVWFMEFQARGAPPHFHILTTCAIPGRTYQGPLWFHIVNSAARRRHKHLVAGTLVKALENGSTAIQYATAYANKAIQKLTPEGFAGVGRSLLGAVRLCHRLWSSRT
jgi:hypothetical protein